MAKILDFNSFEQPTLPIVMKDEKKTTFTVTAPSEELIEKLDANRVEITEKLKNAKDLNSLNALYEFAAELISCNEEHVEITGEELKTTYKVNYMMLFAFYVAYMQFVNEIKNAKN